MTSWLDLDATDPFGLHTLPYGVFSTPGAHAAGRRAHRRVRPRRRRRRGAGRHGVRRDVGVRQPQPVPGRGPQAWAAAREWLTRVLSDHAHRDAVEPHLRALDAVTLHLPFEVADYVDFYASEHHATNVGRDLPPGLRRPPAQLEAPADRLPRPRRHGRRVRAPTSSVRAGSARPIRRRPPSFGPSSRLDIEAEVGFVVGGGTALGDAGGPGRRARAPLRRRAAQRLERPRHPGLGVRAAGPVPRQVVRHVASRRGSRRSRRSTPPAVALPGPGPRAAALPARTTPPRARPAPRGDGSTARWSRAPSSANVLVAGPDAGAPDRQRRLAAQRRPVRVGHGERCRAATRAAACSS